MFLRDFRRLPFAMCIVKNVVKTQPSESSEHPALPLKTCVLRPPILLPVYCHDRSAFRKCYENNLLVYIILLGTHVWEPFKIPHPHLTLSQPGFYVLQKPTGRIVPPPPPLAKTLLRFSESIQVNLFWKLVQKWISWHNFGFKKKRAETNPDFIESESLPGNWNEYRVPAKNTGQ